MTLLVLVTILVGSYALMGAAARIQGWGVLTPGLRGRISLALLLLFTGLGHFVQTEPMARMLPAWVPYRVEIIYATGLLEWLGALGLLVPRTSRVAGLCLLAFFVLVFPANVQAAMSRAPMGGHELGPAYLLVRAPFQILLIWWTYWFAIRRRGRANPSDPA